MLFAVFLLGIYFSSHVSLCERKGRNLGGSHVLVKYLIRESKVIEVFSGTKFQEKASPSLLEQFSEIHIARNSIFLYKRDNSK